MGKYGVQKRRDPVMLRATKKGVSLQTASGRDWFNFAMNSKVLTDKQRERIFARVGYMFA